MAPEQSSGGQVDARSDQFGFCVALYEALYGQRPFRGRYDDARRYVDLGKARARGRLPGKRPGDLPGDIERILLRGLSLHPDRRFPSMRSLLDELEAIAQPNRRWWWLPLGLVGLAAATVIGFMTATTTREPERRACDDGSDLLVGVWDPDVAAELRRAAAATKRPSILEMAGDAAESLDEWAQRWRRARLRACETSSTRSDPSAELLDQRLACLDRQLVRIDSTLGGLRRLFDERPESLPERLDAIGDDLPDPHDCEAAPLDERNHLLPDPALGSTIASLADELAMVEGRFDGDKDYEAAHRAGEALLVRAKASEFDPLIAEVLLLVGEIDFERAQENSKDAELRLSDAAWTAQRAGHDEVLVVAAAKLVEVLVRDGRIESARLWAQLGRATLARLGDESPAKAELQLALAELETSEGDFEGALIERKHAIELLQRLDRTHHRSYLRAELAQANDLRELGRYDEAAQLLERSRLRAIEVHGANHPRVAEVLDALSMLRSAQGQRDEALRLSRQALAIIERVHGKDSLEVAKVLNNLAIVLDQSGRFSEAALVLERARAIVSRVEGERSRTVAYVDVNLGQALHNLGRFDEAAARYESALAVLVELYGSEHPAVVVTNLNLAVTRTHGDDIDAALVQLETGCAQLEALLGVDHPDLAELEHERARALRELGRLDAAKHADQRALGLLEKTFGTAHGALLLPLTGLAQTELALGHVDEALVLVARIEPLLNEETPPIAAAEAKFVAGRVLLASEPERGQRLIDEARALAERTEGAGELLGRIKTVSG
jgi:tetratricopeptide (TPR) repeat protein